MKALSNSTAPTLLDMLSLLAHDGHWVLRCQRGTGKTEPWKQHIPEWIRTILPLVSQQTTMHANKAISVLTSTAVYLSQQKTILCWSNRILVM